MSRFGWQAGDVQVSQCARCVHKHAGGARCDAYPGEIPGPILRGEHDHRRPYFGDGEIGRAHV